MFQKERICHGVSRPQRMLRRAGEFYSQLLMSYRRVRRPRANRGRIGRAISISVPFPKHFAVIGTNGTIAIGGSKIARPSFLLAADIISWTQAIGILLGATIRSIAIMITMALSTLTAICYLIRCSLMSRQRSKMQDI